MPMCAEATDYFFGGLLPALPGGLAGWSPSTVFSGQTLKAGHFRQPATIAIGQTVIFEPSAGRPPAAAV
jgi:hypothetical protein